MLTWHKIMPRNIVRQDADEVEISINFGKFWKCGFYDWRLVLLGDDGRANALNMTKPAEFQSFSLSSQKMRSDYDDGSDQESLAAQGRFVVHARGMRDHIFHEVSIDYQDAQVDFKNKGFIKRGKFEDVERAIPDYKESGVTALYLMGVFERDNVPF